MNSSASLLSQLYAIRNRFGKNLAAKKIRLLQALAKESSGNKTALHLYYDCLLFLLAYPDNKAVYDAASRCLLQQESRLQNNPAVKDRMFNSGISQTELCSSFSFELVKWFRTHHREQIRFDSFDADDGRIGSVLTVVLPRAESEIFQDGNENWRSWLAQTSKPGEELLDRLLAIFSDADISPFVRDELWASLGLNTVICFASCSRLPGTLTRIFYHRSLFKKNSIRVRQDIKPIQVNLTKEQAEQIIGCARTILAQHLREIDPITFTDWPNVSYYHLSRGISIALMGMTPERRSPIDCYMGYMVFKNGLPVAYAGSWILFNSSRIGLNIFPSYRGGESKYIFEQVLNLHRHVYRLHRFTVDPYQIGKDNSDGIHSGAFWIYYQAGFRPLKKEQHELATLEARKIRTQPGYRSPASVLKKLADSRMELLLGEKPVGFDATDISRLFNEILKVHYNSGRKTAREHSFMRLARLLQVKDWQQDTIRRLLNSWSVLLLSERKQVPLNNELKSVLKKMFALKCSGSEEEYIHLLQQSNEVRIWMEGLIGKYLPPVEPMSPLRSRS